MIPPAHNDLIPFASTPSSLEYDKEHEKHPFIRAFKDPKTKLYGFKDQNNTIIIQPMYGWAYDFTVHNVADVRDALDGSKWYQINREGKKLTKRYIFDNGPDYYHLGLRRFERKGKVGFINQKGRIVIDAKYDYANSFMYTLPITAVCEGCVVEKYKVCCDIEVKGGKWSIINNRGEKVIPMEFTDFGPSDKDGALVMLKGKERYKIFFNTRTRQYQAIRQ